MTSRDNPGVKLFRQLGESGKKRKETGLFAAEGLRLCGEAVRCGIKARRLFLTETAVQRWGDAVRALASACGGAVPVSDRVGDYMGDTSTTQGVFLIGYMPEREPFEPERGGSYLLLENLQDPGNTGTIIRCADAFGVTGVVLSANTPDVYSPRVLRASMGSVFRQRIYRSEDLFAAVEKLSRAGISTYAAMPGGGSVPVQSLSGKGGAAAVVGNEGNGITDELAAACAGSVHIPMKGATESLNAASAAAILIWELFGRG